MRQHRVSGVSEEGEAAIDPARKRVAVIEPPAERLVDLVQQPGQPLVPSGEFGAQLVRIARCRPRFLHRLVGGHEADEIDQRAVAQREDEEVLPVAEPHAPFVHRPFGIAFQRNGAAIGQRA